jgi:LacI family fructose operon transcriptional repressor
VRTIQKHTIYDVARAAGVSASTVGSALNGSWKSRRISEDTVKRIKTVANQMGYSVNLQARGLRKARSGLIGMILPQHDNRFFSSIGQSFSNETRNREALPVIVSTRRDREQEIQAVRGLIRYSVDALMLVGTSNPDQLSEICREANLPHVFVDQPCDSAPSVMSDNKSGARRLTDALLGESTADTVREVVFLGGDSALPATRRRIEGFREALEARGHTATDDQVVACGYRRAATHDTLAKLYEDRGRLPPAMFINSITCFEGALEFLVRLPMDEVDACRFGSFDYDPFGSLLRHPIPMIRQRAEEMVRRAYQHIDDNDSGSQTTLIEPELILPNSAMP